MSEQTNPDHHQHHYVLAPRLRAAGHHVESLLVKGETILCYAPQRRWFAITHRRILVVATTGRLIELRRGLIGGYQFLTTRWQDLQEVQLVSGILGATLIIKAFNQPDLASSGTTVYHRYSGLDKIKTEEIYRVAQGQDQAWREKRRLREMEEIRARSGGIQLGAGGQRLAGAASGATGSAAERLAQAKEMLDRGLISDSEYEVAKAKIIGDL